MGEMAELKEMSEKFCRNSMKPKSKKKSDKAFADDSMAAPQEMSANLFGNSNSMPNYSYDSMLDSFSNEYAKKSTSNNSGLFGSIYNGISKAVNYGSNLFSSEKSSKDSMNYDAESRKRSNSNKKSQYLVE